MTVGDIMTSNVITVEMDDTVAGTSKIFELNHLHHAPVVEGTRVVGVVSNGDLLKATSPYANTAGECARDSSTLTKRMHQIMTRKVLTICPTDSLGEAAETMLKNNISCLPVLSNAGAVVGIVTKTDLLKYLLEQLTAIQP